MTIVSINDRPRSLHERQWSAIVDLLEVAISDLFIANTGELAYRILDLVEDLAADEENAECNSEIDSKHRVRVPARTN